MNLNLMTIRFPRTALVSILHRITGVIIFLSLPFLLYILQVSLVSGESFQHLQIFLAKPFNKFLVWFILSAFSYHVLAGIRHLCMDMGMGESLQAGRFSADLVLVLAIISMGSAGFLLW
jgi:succinate dehydrogenase / fumarate reductase cytochrome b subunit